MSETAHTKGPWSAQMMDNEFHTIDDANGVQIGEAYDKDNARLMAAAPETAAERDRLLVEKAELLRVLDYVEKECAVAIQDEPFPDWWRKLHPAAKHSDLPMGLRTVAHIKLSMIQDEVRKAIAKAEGR